MRVLFDESVPRPFAREFVGSEHEVRTTSQMSWTGMRNGALLRQAVATGFGAFVTMDRNLEHQQNVARIGIGVIVLIAPSSRVEDLQPLAPKVEQALSQLRPGEVVSVSADMPYSPGRRRKSREAR